MRIDIVIDRKQVHLPNASTLGFGKYKAQYGDCVLFSEGGQRTMGRVIGRIAYAPKMDNDPDLRNYLVVIALGSNLSFPMERWVDPASVSECFNPQDFGNRDIAAFMSFFFGESFRKHSTEDMRGWVNYGSATVEGYLASKTKE